MLSRTTDHGSMCWTRNGERLIKNKTPNKKGEPVEEQFKNSYKDSKRYCNKDK
tara:strand:- start:185 stop:343 length:159 start_codon:yes stop_codon:yes gene_type:complete